MTNDEKKIGACGLCGGRCFVQADMKDGHIMSVDRLEGHPYLPSDMCVRGAALKQYIYHEDRIQYPMKRIEKDGTVSYERISWDQAISEIADRLLQTRKQYGPYGTIFYAGHPKWFRKTLAELSAAYGTPNFVTESSTCHNAPAIGYKLVFGNDMYRPDMAHCNTVLVWSENLSGQKGDASFLRRLKDKGKHIIVVDPHKTALTEIADLHLQLYPGTDGALALGIANVILAEGLEDKKYIEQFTYGFSEYREYVMQFTPQKAAEITGVPEEDIVLAAHIMAEMKVALKCSNCSLFHCINGVQNMRAILSLLALTGSIGTEGGLMPPGGGTASLDTFFHVLADRPDLEHDIADGEFPVWNELVNNEGQCVRLADVIMSGKPYPIRNFIGFGVNLRMWPESDKMLAAMDQIEFSVVTELFWNEACERADFVLPACAGCEMDQVVVGNKNHLMLVEHMIDPGEKLPDIEIILRLAHAMELHGRFIDNADYDAYLNYTMRLTGVTLDELKAHPEGMDAVNVPPRKSFSPADGFNTPSGKIEFVSQVLEKYKDIPGYDPLPVYTDWRDEITRWVPDRENYPLALVVGPRKPFLFHSRTYRTSWLSGLETHTRVTISPAEADRLGVREGDRITLTTPKGSENYFAEIDSGMLDGVVYTFHDDGLQDANRLVDGDYLDPISGFPGYRSYVCSLKKAEVNS